MEFKKSIFYTGKEAKFNNYWKEKDMFPLIQTNLETINKDLIKNGIKKVICFDQIGEKWEDWICEKELTLAVLPISNIIDQSGINTKKELRALGFQAKEKYFPVDIITAEDHAQEGLVYYFPTRNLLISLVNPFKDAPLLSTILEMISNLQPKFMTEEQIGDHILKEQWKINITTRIEAITNSITLAKQNINSYKEKYFKQVQELSITTAELKKMSDIKGDISSFIKRELEKIRKLPMINDLKIKDKIYVSFGKIFLTGKVRVGMKEGAVEVPIMETRKVLIGDLTFIIGNGEIKIENENSIGEFQHPHAREGNLCFGDIDLEAKRLLANLELTKLISLLYSWAFSYNEEDPYIELQKFYDKEIEND